MSEKGKLPELRYYQTDVIARARSRITGDVRRVIIQASTGAGKTHISSEMLRVTVAKGRRGLFIAHRRRLISQKCERLDLFGVPYGVLMSGETSNRSAPVQVASRDTMLSRSVRNEWMTPPPADVVIVDECHTCMSDEYQQLLDMYKGAVIIGLTATPARSDGKSLSPFFQAMECAVPTSQLIREGYLVPVNCYAPETKGRLGSTKRELHGDPVYNWKLYAEGRPTVLFAARKEASRAVVMAFNAAGIPAEHIDSETPHDERDRVVERVQSGKTMVVSNVGIWTEGVDIPELSCCILLRMAGSYVLFAQAVGRIMRPAPGKTDAVLIDHAGAVLEHGFPDEDVPWSLDENGTVDKRVKDEKEEGKRREPICCPSCAYVFSGSLLCPSCGYQMRPKKSAKHADTSGEILSEVKKCPHADREDRTRYWHVCLRVMASKGYKAAAAGVMFKRKFGAWPSDDLPNMPGRNEWQLPVSVLFPGYVRRASHVV